MDDAAKDRVDEIVERMVGIEDELATLLLPAAA